MSDLGREAREWAYAPERKIPLSSSQALAIGYIAGAQPREKKLEAVRDFAISLKEDAGHICTPMSEELSALDLKIGNFVFREILAILDAKE